MNNDAPPPPGLAELYLPADWLDLLDDGPGPDADQAAGVRFAQLIATTLPGAGPELVAAGAQALLAWRARLLGRGVIGHGVVNVPLDEHGEPTTTAPGIDHDRWACWHVLVGVVALPPTVAELDLGEFLARVLGHRLDPACSYLEAFPTAMGCGTGLLLQPALLPGPLAVPESPAPDPAPGAGPHYGLTAALSFAHGGGCGLLVTGVCLDPDQLVGLGALVALIAGRSRLQRTGD
ncbi:MAG: hypothetical protein ACT4QG_02985 [Sporichthyaceae bacterium]